MVTESKGKSDGSASLIGLGRGLLAKPENNSKNKSELLDCPIPGSVQSETGWSLQQPGLVGDVPAHVRAGMG